MNNYRLINQLCFWTVVARSNSDFFTQVRLLERSQKKLQNQHTCPISFHVLFFNLSHYFKKLKIMI